MAIARDFYSKNVVFMGMATIMNYHGQPVMVINIHGLSPEQMTGFRVRAHYALRLTKVALLTILGKVRWSEYITSTGTDASTWRVEVDMSK